MDRYARIGCLRWVSDKKSQKQQRKPSHNHQVLKQIHIMQQERGSAVQLRRLNAQESQRIALAPKEEVSDDIAVYRS